MKISQEEYEIIEKILKELKVRNYTINDDGTVDVDGHVWLDEKGLKEIPVQFGEVKGGFDCRGNKLATLEGVPKYVGRDFDCSGNNLSTLKFSPEYVGGNFKCWNNNLTSLKGVPKYIKSSFWCHENRLASLEGAPQKVGNAFYCTHNKLTTLKGAPEYVGGFFNVAGNKLTSLKGSPKKLNGINCASNKLEIDPEIELEELGVEVKGKILSDFS